MIDRITDHNFAAGHLRGAVDWLDRAEQVSHPLAPTHPIWVQEHVVGAEVSVPRPSVPNPEWHSYCELNFNFDGRLLQFVGNESFERKDGDLMLLGAGTPHYAIQLTAPQRAATVYFLPDMLLELGPEGDGALLLERCGGPVRIEDRIVRPPAAVRRRIGGLFEEMLAEFAAPQIGTELRLRALLVETLVAIIRWEQSEGRNYEAGGKQQGWRHVGKAIRFMHERYAETVYIHEIAQAAGLSEVRLQEYFHATLRQSCNQYLRTYRLSRATALLSRPDARVTEVALSVGFETLSHFNTSFRKYFGMSPTEYMQQKGRNKRHSPPK